MNYIVRPIKRSVRLSSSIRNDGEESFAMKENSHHDKTVPERMANLYTEWNIDDDLLLFKNRNKPLSEVSAMLGRGLRGVECRLEKLNDVNSFAYTRLFAQQGLREREQNDIQPRKLMPAREVLRRVLWDDALCESDFTIVYYDRVADDLMESKVNMPNTSVSGKETRLCLAIPEHRIVAIKYKEQIVWDKENRMDLVFGSMRGDGRNIYDVMANYDDWKREQDAIQKEKKERKDELGSIVTAVLGIQGFLHFEELLQRLLSRSEMERISAVKVVKDFIHIVRNMFLESSTEEDANDLDTILPFNEIEWLHEYVSLSQDSFFRSIILEETEKQTGFMDDKNNDSNSLQSSRLPKLKESELKETFVRGSGAGGQKVNKTSNKVVLVHLPTQLRVECQETRSLQQNRKIARKRLQFKLDELLNGNQSKKSLERSEVASKKAKAKARSKSRLKKKMEAKAKEVES
jgi:uncharacterized protein (UPF0248 family)